MATLKQYLKNLQEDYKPQPSLIDEDTEQKAETYTETDIPIEGEPISDTEQKAAAFDYLTGRSGGDE